MAICTRHCRSVAACASWITYMGSQKFLKTAFDNLKAKINIFRTNWLLSSTSVAVTIGAKVYASDWNTKVDTPITQARDVSVNGASVGALIGGLTPDYAIGRMNTAKCTTVCASYCTSADCSCVSDCACESDCGSTCSSNCGATCTCDGDCGVTCGATCSCLGCELIAD